MTVLRFVSLMLTSALICWFVVVEFSFEPERRVVSERRQTIDPTHAEVLEDGQGVEELEILQANWVLGLDRTDVRSVEAATRLLTHIRTEGARRGFLDGLVERQTQDWPADFRGEFLRALAPGAVDAAIRHGVPASVTLAQAIQESGWGRSTLATQHNNLFGVKSGAVEDGVELGTSEVRNGQAQRTRERFRRFGTWAESIEHHGRLLSTDSRYATARDHRRDWAAYLSRIAPVYASDPQYAQRVGWFIEHYGLDRWDRLVGTVETQSI